MFNILISNWHPTHTDISKCIIGRFAQSIDPDETITFKYHATNGYILVSEVVETSRLTLKRPKNVSRLTTLLDECVDKEVSTSLVNDPVIIKFHPNAAQRAMQWQNLCNAKGAEWLTLVHNDALALERQLRAVYESQLLEIIRNIPWQSTAFGTEANIGCNVIEAFVAQMLYAGFSRAHLKTVARRLQTSPLIECSPILEDLLSTTAQSEFEIILYGRVNPALRNELQVKQGPSFQGKALYHFRAQGRDAVSAASKAIVDAARSLHLRQKGIPAYNISNIVEKNVFLPVPNTARFRQVADEFNGDPHLVKSRPNSLPQLLESIGTKLETLDSSVIAAVEESIFLYNQALYANSADNSFMLMWTALESMMGLKGTQNDISVVRNNAGSLFSMSALGRRVFSISRLLRLGNAKYQWWQPTWPDELDYTERSFCDWTQWLIEHIEGDPDDPYPHIQIEPLVSRQYLRFNEGHRTCKDVREKVERSYNNVNYQFERLYLTRNRIVHSGEFQDHSKGLWSHLEFYCSRILVTGIEGLLNGTISKQEPWDDLFSQVRVANNAALEYLKESKVERVTTGRLLAAGLFRFPPSCK